MYVASPVVPDIKDQSLLAKGNTSHVNKKLLEARRPHILHIYVCNPAT